MTRKSLVPIQLPADPTAALEAATKQYVDNTGLGYVGMLMSTTETGGIVGSISGLTGLALAFTAVAGRRYLAIGQTSVRSSVANDTAWLHLYDAGGAATLAWSYLQLTSPGNTQTMQVFYANTASISGSKTWQLVGQRAAGTGTLIFGNTGHPQYILIQDIGKF